MGEIGKSILGETRKDFPSQDLLNFIWYFLSEHKKVIALLLCTGLGVAWADALVPLFIGKLVAVSGSADREQALAQNGLQLIALLFAIGALRPLLIYLDLRLRNHQLVPRVTSRMRWLSIALVARQSLGFFQNDFPGRIANRVMHTAGAIRESAESAIRAVWYLTAYGGTTLFLLAQADTRLAVPILIWFVSYVLLLRYYVPRLSIAAESSADAYSELMGRLVDSYSNVLILKLFPYTQANERYVGEALLDHDRAQLDQMRCVTNFISILTALNTFLLVSTAGYAVLLWQRGSLQTEAVAMALPLVWQVANTAGWVAWEVSGIFNNLADVRQGIATIAAPNAIVDAPDATPIVVTQGAIKFDKVCFGYYDDTPTFQNLDLTINPGERVGLVGRSGAGKSTLVSLLLRLFDVQAGSILLEGRDIRSVTVDSLRAGIGVVTQDTALFNRSIRDNILCGRTSSTQEEQERALRQSRAIEFVRDLRDECGRTGLDAFVGDRGVKLSGGQRQRIVLARTLLKDAKILILDEATSALDSEAELAIQEQLELLMEGRTVITIAHRLSTLAKMDRIIVLDRGRIVQEGTHEDLLKAPGLYADLWAHQSGGRLPGSEHMLFQLPRLEPSVS